MRPVRFNVAMSLDGFIAGPEGKDEPISQARPIHFGALFARI